ncbi:unnamed protein product [Phytophthora fragariaefolia]|uniref:Unnamed protein product n=1 Tax=Phytophthora fragariaefolia TaxID=1490495 RepID=A0A9W6Y8I5_9STRA|nr:unnamed protein product [Phytophthora fragariaefolia]
MHDLLVREVDATEAPEEGGGLPRLELEVTTLWFDNCRFLSASEDLALLAKLVTLPSSKIRDLSLPGAYLNSLRNPAGLQGFQAFARQVLAPSSPLRSLDLTRVGIDSNSVAAICSALRYPSPLTKLSVGYTTRGAHSNSRLLWAWIFLAILHEDSGSGLEHLDVSGLQLQTQDMEALVAMLESPHPGKTLVLLQDGRLPVGEGCEECELPPGERLFVRLLDGSQAWTSPGYSAAWSQLLSGTLEANDFEYEVMVRLVDWLCILIPGYGFGWVVRSAVRYEVSKPSLVARMPGGRAQPSLRSLTYRGAEEQSSGVLGLLRLLGRSLISLDVPACGLNSQNLDTILHVCPNLSHLNVTCNVMTDLSPLLRAYGDGRCQIARLGVLVESINPAIAAQLQSLLMNSSNKCLERLQLEVIGQNALGNRSEQEIWCELQRAVSSNSTLRCLYLSLLSSDTHKAASTSIKPFHGQLLCYNTPLQLKISFLSVAEHDSLSSSAGLLDQMPSEARKGKKKAAKRPTASAVTSAAKPLTRVAARDSDSDLEEKPAPPPVKKTRKTAGPSAPAPAEAKRPAGHRSDQGFDLTTFMASFQPGRSGSADGPS